MLVSLIATAALLTSAADEVQMIDKKIGTGLEVGDGDVATVLYSGWLQTGYEFDTTNGKPPLAFAVGAGDVIKGWDVGVKGMKAGGKRVLLVPPAFGYGNKQAGEIPANSTLVFEVELLRVDKKGAEPKIEVKTTTPGTGAAVKSGVPPVKAKTSSRSSRWSASLILMPWLRKESSRNRLAKIS